MKLTRRWIGAAAATGVLFALVLAAGARASELTLELVASGLDRPVHVTAPAGDPRLFVVEQVSGLVRLVEDGVVAGTPFLDLSDRVNPAGDERGLLGLAFHPDFATNGELFVDYVNLANETVVSRLRASSPDAAFVDPSTEEALLVVTQPFLNHNGGMLAFAPDGMLWIGMGDGGGAGAGARAQDLGSLFGKLLRIDVDAGTPYAIPADNPFVGVPGARGEVFHLGLRNPWRFAFDEPTGDLYVGDVGQSTFEEIDRRAFADGPANFGWPCFEGTLELEDCADGTVTTPPLLTYDHGELRCAVTGGRVYRGDAIPSLRGRYVYADFCSAQLWSVDVDGGVAGVPVEHTADLAAPGAPPVGWIASIGEGGDRELYVLDHFAGRVHRVVPGGPWLGLGQGLAGAGGEPTSWGEGPLAAASAGRVVVEGVAARAAGAFIVGFAALEIPFKGGTMVPQPEFASFAVADLTGGAEVVFDGAAGLPAGTVAYVQFWALDVSAPKGFSASNGLRAVVP